MVLKTNDYFKLRLSASAFQMPFLMAIDVNFEVGMPVIDVKRAGL
jgi:hypothetical protein